MDFANLYLKYRLSDADRTNFIYMDKDMKVLYTYARAACFGGFNYAYDDKKPYYPYIDKEVVYCQVWMPNRTSHKTSKVFVDEWKKQGLLDVAHSIDITDDRVALTVDLNKVTPQTFFYLFTIMRMMALQPMQVFFFKRLNLMPDSEKVDFAYKLLLVHKFMCSYSGNMSHWYASPVWKKPMLTYHEIVEKLQSYPIDRTEYKGYKIDDTGVGMTNLIAFYGDINVYNRFSICKAPERKIKLNKENLTKLISYIINGEHKDAKTT